MQTLCETQRVWKLEDQLLSFQQENGAVILADIKINLKSLLVPTHEPVSDSSINNMKELANFRQVLKNMKKFK